MAIYRRDIRQVTKASAPANKELAKKENLLDLLLMSSKEELIKFIIDYSKEQPGLHDTLQDFLLPPENSPRNTNYDTFIEELLNDGREAMKYHSRHDNPLDQIVDELERLVWKAERYADRSQYNEALVIAFAVMEHVALSMDDFHDHDGELVLVCNDAESVVDEIIRSDIPHDLLHDVVAKLNKLREIDNFEAYGLADINFLLLFTTLKTSGPDEALQLLSRAIKEENNPFRCTEMVKTMLNILQKNGRTKEYRETIEKYLFLPEIMKIKYEWLATKKDWDGLLELLDKSIVNAERENRGVDLTKLKEDKLHVYQLMHDPEKIIEMATELFYTGGEPMVKYHLLKKTIPVMQWPDFLDQLLSNPRNYPWRNVNAEIYIEEGRWDKLMDWVREHTRLSAPCDTAQPYDKYLMKHHPERYLEMYRVRLLNYAYGNTGRAHYRFIANTMKRLQTYPGGEALVKELTEIYRTYYSNRPAMMNELGL